MIRAAHAAAAATIATAVIAVILGASYSANEDVVFWTAYLRAAAVAGSAITAVLVVGQRIINEIRASGAAEEILRTADRYRRAREE